jgi:hypothetical protein
LSVRPPQSAAFFFVASSQNNGPSKALRPKLPVASGLIKPKIARGSLIGIRCGIQRTKLSGSMLQPKKLSSASAPKRCSLLTTRRYAKANCAFANSPTTSASSPGPPTPVVRFTGTTSAGMTTQGSPSKIWRGGPEQLRLILRRSFCISDLTGGETHVR